MPDTDLYKASLLVKIKSTAPCGLTRAEQVNSPAKSLVFLSTWTEINNRYT